MDECSGNDKVEESIEISEKRDRIPTEKGLAWKTDNYVRDIRSLISRWHRCSQQLNIHLSDTEDSKLIVKERDNLVNIMNELSNKYTELSELPQCDELDNIRLRYESIEADHTKTAELKVKLKYLDVESKAKLEFDRVKALKGLELAQANMEAIDADVIDFEEPSRSEAKPTLPSVDRDSYTKDYVLAHTAVKDERLESSQTNHPIEPSIKVENQDQPVLGLPRRLSNSTISSSNLNPSVSEFYPKPVHTHCEGPAFSTSCTTSHPKGPFCSHRETYSSQGLPVNAPVPSFNAEQGIIELAKSLAEQVSLTRLPPPEPTVFSGDPLKYPGWKAAFQTLIEHRNIPSSERIHYLKKYLSGNAREAVENYFLLSTDETYENAKRLLDERFEPKLISKLPDWVVARWGRVVYQWKEDGKGFPSFKTFVDFVDKEAKIACDPITSLQSLRTEMAPEGRGKSRGVVKTEDHFKGRSFLSNTNDNNSVHTAGNSRNAKFNCPLCQAGHELDFCRKFLAKTVDERKDFARENKLCFGCLRSGHISKKCENRKKCKTCTKFHPTSLHGSAVNFKKSQSGPDLKNSEKDKPDEGNDKNPQSGISLLNNAGAHCKTSMIVPVFVSHCDSPEREVLVYALLDTQSDTTFVLSNTCDSLGVYGAPVSLVLSTMHAENKTIQSHRVRGLVVRGFDSTLKIPLPNAFCRDTIPGNRDHIPTPEVAKLWPHLEDIAGNLMPLSECEFGLLIGYNCARALMPREIIPPSGNGPYGQRTDLGWSIVGIVDPSETLDNSDDCIGISHHICTHEVSSALISEANNLSSVSFSFPATIKVEGPIDVIRMLELDFIDRSANGLSVSLEDKQFMRIMSQGIHKHDGHYTMPLPFKGDPPSLPCNKEMALQRLISLRKRFRTNKEFQSYYKVFMDNLIQQGHAERVSDSDALVSDGREWYIPHHGVFHPHKPGKLRVVFDCSASLNGESLNKHLLQGPDLTNTLVGVLCRFRMEKIAFVCDIEQMFHQFKVHEAHRNYLKFLWWSDDNMSQPVTLRMCVHLFGATSSPACANFGLKQVATDNESEFGKDVADFLRNNFYVDDGLKSVKTEKEAICMIKGTQELCKKGGLRLHKFTCNSKEVLQHIPLEDRAKGLADVDIFADSLPVERTLGVQWNIQSDAFQFKITLSDKPLTRRGILSTVSSIYDPLGLLSPITLVGRRILQQMCAENFDWDDPISDNIYMQWQQWREDLQNLKTLQVTRCFKPDDFGDLVSVQFHHFSDASTNGYGQCSYLRLQDHEGKIHCSLLMAKARVVPLKTMTIPRLELTAATVSIKISNLLKKELHYEAATHHFWTDSRVVLGYISNDSKRFHVFVANRVQQIRDFSDPSQWRYIETTQNVADIASRGAMVSELVNSKWFTGPDFIWEKESIHVTKKELHALSENDPELRSKCFASVVQICPFSSILERLEYFSDWNHAKVAIALCLRFKRMLMNRLVKRPKPQILNVDLHEFPIKTYQRPTVEDLRQAEIEIIRQVQSTSFEREVKCLLSQMSTKQSAIGRDSCLYRLSPVIDENGLIRVGGRLNNASLNYGSIHPIVLPRKCHVTKLVIKYYHERVQHQGRGITTNEIRGNGYWIIGCSSAVSDLIFHCTVCRKLRGSVQDQRMSDLPFDRVDPAPPFTYSGVDFFGPFHVKEGRKDLKRYGVLFTCLTCRAIHIEIANTLDTHSFINALRRFLSVRGPIRQLRSDRGTNFVGAERELREAVSEMNNDKITNFLLKEGCDTFLFKFNVPSASHMGGVWERQIRTVRNILSGLLHNFGGQLDDEALRTFACEVTAIVNSRPLSVESLNDPLSAEPLTPNHLLTMKTRVLLPPPGNFISTDLYTRRRWRRIQYLANEFWNRWRTEYLNNLQVRSKWISAKRNIKVNDVVLVKDENMPRNKWRMAVVETANPDSDGMVRKVSVKTNVVSFDAKGKAVKSITHLERPVHKLVLLHEAPES
ncbi:uncharacterized protein LOC132750093 [Ruditapes philippinarum]|uniref:uncharacterized protein LOC132750093 n=1 Tax=Ruditapes philippinarum TaxID=129788 RepID=UPI00295B9C2D|nr:uncharacterized protein LOC132750093 [Ruditapes philippinarum]